MKIKARHNFIIYPFFKRYTRYKLSVHFSKIVIQGSIEQRELPVLLIANHISWWDGFWAVNINQQILKKKFHFMMLEEQLRKFWFFRYCGGFPVRKNSRSVIKSLDYAAELLTDPDNAVLFFPQGKIWSSHLTHLRFEKGIEYILKKTEQGKIQVVFLVNFTEYLSESRPSLYQYLEEYEGDDFSCHAIENAYNDFFTRCLSIQSQMNE
ncbi:MAG TPA: lysophospholipid acyltransferase family protein [Bacteroidales bacterium]|nr:lysophospholipid acyltransferase family protein [Bacteroidales bacterium]HPT12083.1 lysophospholipid acyltransferase family protein [Bacteroidales bacterium]